MGHPVYTYTHTHTHTHTYAYIYTHIYTHTDLNTKCVLLHDLSLTVKKTRYSFRVTLKCCTMAQVINTGHFECEKCVCVCVMIYMCETCIITSEKISWFWKLVKLYSDNRMVSWITDYLGGLSLIPIRSKCTDQSIHICQSLKHKAWKNLLAPILYQIPC